MHCAGIHYQTASTLFQILADGTNRTLLEEELPFLVSESFNTLDNTTTTIFALDTCTSTFAALPMRTERMPPNQYYQISSSVNLQINCITKTPDRLIWPGKNTSSATETYSCEEHLSMKLRKSSCRSHYYNASSTFHISLHSPESPDNVVCITPREWNNISRKCLAICV